MDDLDRVLRPHLVLLVAPPLDYVEVLVRCLLAVRAVAVRAATGRHAQALVDTVPLDLAVADARVLDADPDLGVLLESTSVPLVLMGEPLRVPAPSAVAALADTSEPFEVAMEVQRLTTALDSGVLRWGPLSLDVRRRECQWLGMPLQLTPTQFRIMATLVHARGAVVSRGELCRRSLGGFVAGDCERLDAHLRRIRKLIEPDPSRAAFVLTVRGEGVRLADPSTRGLPTLAAAPRSVVASA